MWILRQNEMCSMSPACFSLLSFLHTLEGRRGIHEAILSLPLRSSQWFQHTGSHSIIVWPDWEESFLLLWLHFHYLCLLPCLILDSTWLEKKYLGETLLFLSTITLQLLALSTSRLCKLIFKSVKITLLNRQHLLQKSGRQTVSKGTHLLTGTDWRQSIQINHMVIVRSFLQDFCAPESISRYLLIPVAK